MINFVDITYEIPYQNRIGIPYISYGKSYATKSKPLPFQYQSTEEVSSFVAKGVNNLGEIVESVSLSTSLINADGSYHICDGLSTYASDLDCGTYYFLVNSKYQSDNFTVETNLTDGTLNQPLINISGLEFFNNLHSVPWRDRIGKPDIFYGIQYAENSTPLYFDYLATENINTFKAIKVDNLGNDISETTLSTSLIDANGSHHICSGLVDYSTDLNCGVYYFSVNDKYESELFRTIELENVLQGIGYDIIENTLIVY